MKHSHQPIRTCRGCGRKALKKDLDRFVFTDGGLTEDMNKRYQTRGIYCCRNTACRERLQYLQKKRKRNKSYLQDVYVSKDGSVQ